MRMSHPPVIIGAMVGVAAVVEVREKVAALAVAFDPALVTAADAQRIVEEATRAGHMLATVAALAAGRVAETELWRRNGDRSPAHHLARLSGTSVGSAQAALATAEALGTLPELEAAARGGQVSPAQASAIADAAGADPRSERRLLERAQRGSLGELKDECARTKAAAVRDAEARHRAIHAARFLRKRRCADGAAELHYRSTPEEVAQIFATAQGYATEAFHQARREGRREPEEAYLADGLLHMAQVAADPAAGVRAEPEPEAVEAGDGAAGAGAAPEPGTESDDGKEGPEPGPGATGHVHPGLLELYQLAEEAGELPPGSALALAARSRKGARPRPASPPGGRPPPGRNGPGRRPRPRPIPAKISVRIDWDALVRGHPIEGEVCEVAGIGPVPVSVVRAMIDSGDPFLAAVVTRGTDVVNVAHLGRNMSAAQRTAWEWTHPVCVVEGCNNAVRLEADHRVPWAEAKVTLLGNMDGPCGFHHDLKTYRGWALVEGLGKRPMVSPEDPRHPDNVARAAE
jgi:hypothetical protein